MSRQLFYILTLLFALILISGNDAHCGLHQEMCLESGCIKTCSGKEVCHSGPHCACMTGFVLDEDTDACCHISHCPALLKAPMKQHSHFGMIEIHTNSRIRQLGHGLSEKLLSSPLVPVKLVKGVGTVVFGVVSFIPKKMLDVAEDGANEALEGTERVVDYIRYDVTLSGHTVGEIWFNIKEHINHMAHENRELIDSAGRSVLHVENGIHDKIYGIGRSILPNLRMLPSYVKRCDYNKFLSKDAFVGSIMKVGREGAMAREKAKKKKLLILQN